MTSTAQVAMFYTVWLPAPSPQLIGSVMDTDVKTLDWTEVAWHKKVSWANWILFLSDSKTVLGRGTKQHGENKALNTGIYEEELGHGGC